MAPILPTLPTKLVSPITLLTIAAGLACLAVVRHALARASADRAARIEAERARRDAVALGELTAALSRTRLPRETEHAALVEIVHAFTASAGLFMQVTEDGQEATLVDTIGCPDDVAVGHAVPLGGKTPIAESIRRFELVVSERTPDDLLRGFAASAVVPLVSAQRAIGAIVIGFGDPEPLDGDARARLLTAARHVTPALVRALAYEAALRTCEEGEEFRVRADAELRERHRAEDALRDSEGKYRALAARMTRLYELSAALSEAITLDSVAKVIVRHGKAVVGASAGCVAMCVDGGQFETLYAEDYTRLAVESWHRFAAEPGFCATAAAATRAPVFVGSLDEWQRHYPRSGALAADGGFESAAALPLLSEGASIGVLSFHFTAPVNFTDDYTALLRSVAQHCGQALDRARLYEAAQRARADAETANRAKDDFLSTLSHELRTPLNAMLGWASMLRSGTLDQEKRARALDAIFGNASRQAQLIEDLLDVSRIIAGRASLDREEVAIGDTLRGAVDAIMPTAESKGVRLQLDPLGDAALAADPRRLEQVFLNLIANAVKFTPAGGRVTVGAAVHDGMVDVRVADTGAGIDPAFLPHVFDRFRQGDASAARRVGGLGLGLFIARRLVEAHGGTITAESPGVDAGATFTVRLPIIGTREAHEPAPAPALPAAATAEPPQLSGVRVLLVDDEPDALEVMSSALETCGASVTTAASAREALESLSRDRFDVLLSDIAMPDADGYELIRGVRGLAPAPASRIPAAAVTAFASDEDRRRALAAGFHTHLAKPIPPGLLAETVATLAQQRV
ncbi:MAG TPA: ATP-binding protein [Vicinamibacterales bacterium]|nr:ATP-binding protein [Vicinamibacterales bacterium]